MKFIVTKHAHQRLVERAGENMFGDILKTPARLYKDRYKKNKFYYNMKEDGFAVLMRIKRDTFLVKTVTSSGRIDNRGYIVARKKEVLEYATGG